MPSAVSELRPKRQAICRLCRGEVSGQRGVKDSKANTAVSPSAAASSSSSSSGGRDYDSDGVYCLQRSRRGKDLAWMHKRCVWQSDPTATAATADDVEHYADIDELTAEDKRRMLRHLLAEADKHCCHVCRNKGASLKCCHVDCHAMMHPLCVPPHHVVRQDGHRILGHCALHHTALQQQLHTAQPTPRCVPDTPTRPPGSPASSSSSQGSTPPRSPSSSASTAAAAANTSAGPSLSPSRTAAAGGADQSGAHVAEHSELLDMRYDSATGRLHELRYLLLDHDIGHLDLTYAVRELDRCIAQHAHLTSSVRVFLAGSSGNGKTMLANLVLFLTAASEAEYRSQPTLPLDCWPAMCDEHAASLAHDFHDLFRRGKPTNDTGRVRNYHDGSGAVTPSTTSHTPQRQPLQDSECLQPPTPQDETEVGAASFSAQLPASATPAQPSTPPLPPAPLSPLLTAMQYGYSSGVADPRLAPSSTRLDEHVLLSEPARPAGMSSVGRPTVHMQLSSAGSQYLSATDRQAEFRSTWDEPLLRASHSPLEKGKLTSWLLWSANEGDACTGHLYRLLHAPTWHATIQFMPLELAQDMALDYVRKMIQLHSGESDDDDGPQARQLAKERYDSIVNLPLAAFHLNDINLTAAQLTRMLADDIRSTRSQSRQERYKQLATIYKQQPASKLRFTNRAAKLPVDASLLPYLGEMMLFAGCGQSFFADREYVRRQLRYWCHNHEARHVITLCSVYAPCGVLRDIELWEGPGTNDDDPTRRLITQEALAKAHVILTLLNKALDAEKATKDELARNGLLHAKLADPDHAAYAAFLHCSERSDRPTLATVLASLQRQQQAGIMVEQDIVLSGRNMVHKSAVSVQQMLSMASVDGDRDDSGEGDDDDEDNVERQQQLADERLQALMTRTTTFQYVMPVMFTSIMLQRALQQQQHDQSLALTAASVDDVVSLSQGYALLGLFGTVAPVLRRQHLERFTDPYHAITFHAKQAVPRRNTRDSLHAHSAGVTDSDSDAAITDDECSDDGEAEWEPASHSNEDEADERTSDTAEQKQPPLFASTTAASSSTSTSPASSSPDTALIQCALDAAGCGTLRVTPGSRLYDVLLHMAKFIEQHTGGRLGNEALFSAMKWHAKGALFKPLLSARRKWGQLKATTLETALATAKQRMDEWAGLLQRRCQQWRDEMMESERQHAIRTARRELARFSDKLQLRHVDPNASAAIRKHLHRIMFEQLSSIQSLHVRELHDLLRAGVLDMFKQVRQHVYEPALSVMFPHWCHMQPFQQAVRRASEHAFQVPFLARFADCLHGSDGRSVKRSKEVAISGDELRLVMQRLCKADTQDYLEHNAAHFRSLWRGGKGRQAMVAVIDATLDKRISDVLQRLTDNVTGRMLANLQHFFDYSFFGSMHGVFADAVHHFVSEAARYCADVSDDVILERVRHFTARLQRWQDDTKRVMADSSASTPEQLGREMAASVDRNAQYARWTAEAGMSRAVVDAIREAQQASPHSLSELDQLHIERATAAQLDRLWHSLTASGAAQLSELPHVIHMYNAAMQRRGRPLTVAASSTPIASLAALATPLSVAEVLLHSVADGVLSCGNRSRLQHSVHESTVAELVAALRAHVSAQLLDDRQSTVRALMQQHGMSECRQLLDAFQVGRLSACAHVLQLLASFLRCCFVVWSPAPHARQLTLGCRALMPQHNTSSPAAAQAASAAAMTLPCMADTAVDLVVHLALVPIDAASLHKPAASSDRQPPLDHPFLLLPVFDTPIRKHRRAAVRSKHRAHSGCSTTPTTAEQSIGGLVVPLAASLSARHGGAAAVPIVPRKRVLAECDADTAATPSIVASAAAIDEHHSAACSSSACTVPTHPWQPELSERASAQTQRSRW